MTIEEFIVDYRNKLVKKFEEVKTQANKITAKKSPTIEEMLNNSYKMGVVMGKIDVLNDFTNFVLKSNLEKVEVKKQ